MDLRTDIVEIWFGIANWQISSVFEIFTCISPRHIHICLFRTITLNINGFSPNLKCILILWRSGLGLHMGTLRQLLTKLSPDDTIMAGYYRFTLVFQNETYKGN